MYKSACIEQNLREKISTDLPTHFVGLGGAGSKVVEFLFSKGIDAHFTSVTYPSKSMNSNRINYIPIEHIGYISHGFQPSIDFVEECNSNILSPTFQKLIDIFNSDHHFVLLSGLGTYTGLCLTQVFTLWLYANNKSFHTICTTPFAFEGKVRSTFATITQAKLSSIPNFHCLELDNLRTQYGYLTLSQAFEKVNEEYFNVYKNLLN